MDNQATQTKEFGDGYDLTGSGTLRTLRVTFSNWALYAEYASDDRYRSNTESWTHPIQITFYEVGAGNTVGPVIGTKTEAITIPWRPTAAGATLCPANPSGWFDGTSCYSGKAFDWTFDIASLGISVPHKVIVGIAYSTETYGQPAIGTRGPYNSFNVGLNSGVNAGSNPNLDVDVVFWNTSTRANYTDLGAGGVGTFRADTGWTGYVPAFYLTAH